MNSHKNDPKPSGSSPSPSGSSPSPSGSPPSNSTLASNVVGAMHSVDDVRVDKSPFKVSRCDQVLTFDADTFSDHDDYASRKKAYFTISAYLINVFDGKDVNKLDESISLYNIKDSPKILMGSKSCVNFNDKTNVKNITICMSEEHDATNIIKAFEKLMQCRTGSDMEDFDPMQVDKILKASCKGNSSPDGKTYDLKSLRDQIAENLIHKGVIYYLKLVHC